MQRNCFCASWFFYFSSVNALLCTSVLTMDTLRPAVFWSSGKLTSLRGTSASALPPLTIFHSLFAFQWWLDCTWLCHQLPQTRRGCIPAQHRLQRMIAKLKPGVSAGWYRDTLPSAMLQQGLRVLQHVVFFSSPTCPKLWKVKTDWATTRGLNLFWYLASSANFHLLVQTRKQQCDLGVLNEADFHFFYTLRTLADQVSTPAYSTTPRPLASWFLIYLKAFECTNATHKHQNSNTCSGFRHHAALRPGIPSSRWWIFYPLLSLKELISERECWAEKWENSRVHRSLTQLKQLC